MAAKIITLRTRADRLRAEQAAELRQTILGHPDLPKRAVDEIVAVIDRQTSSAERWPFVMLSPEANRDVIRWLRRHSSYPLVAADLWGELFVHVDRTTGEIHQSREELAKAVGTTPRNVSRVMSELESIKAISRHREKIAGMKGRGAVHYFLNARVATHLPGAARDAAQRAAPVLRLVPDTATTE